MGGLYISVYQMHNRFLKGDPVNPNQLHICSVVFQIKKDDGSLDYLTCKGTAVSLPRFKCM